MLYPLIDTHVHCRDWDEKYKTTILEVTTLLRRNGGKALIDMPNTKPRILYRADVKHRNETAESQGCRKGYYLNIGGTKNPKQIEEAVEAVDNYDNVTGIKFFTTGNDSDPLVIKNEIDQASFYKNLREFGYKGVVIPHCEKESLFKIGRFNPDHPWTWNEQRPKEAEVASIKDQIRLSVDASFNGHIHFPHVTCADSLDAILEHMNHASMSAEVTPQHMLLSTRDMTTRKDLDKKVNPPIRSQEVVDILWERLKDIVEEGNLIITTGSDHAVHTLKEKMEGSIHEGKIEGYLSGYPGQKIYPNLIEELKRHEFSQDDIKNLTYWNAKKIFPRIKE